MENQDTKRIEKLKKFSQMFKNNIVSTDDIEKFLLFMIDFIKESKNNFESISAENLKVIASSIDYIKDLQLNTANDLSIKSNTLLGQIDTKINLLRSLIEEVKAIKSTPGQKGEDADEEIIVSKVLEQIKLPEYKETVLDTAEQIADKLETLKDDKRLDASAIKNLPEFIDSRPNGGGWRNFFQMHDTAINNPTNGQVPVYDSTLKVWKNQTPSGGGTIGGSIASDEIAIGNGTNTITGLAGAPGNVVRFDTGSLPVISDSLIDGSGASSVEFFNRILSDGGVASVNWDTRELFDSTGALAGTWSATGIELVKSLKVQGITTATIEFLNNTTSPAVSSLAVPALIDVVGGQNTLLGEPAGWVIVDTPAGAKKMPYYDL